MFISGAEIIRSEIERVIERSASDFIVCIAVAFWGQGAERLFPAGRRYRIVCNLSLGGTNPLPIRELMAHRSTEVRHLPTLHAKVLLGANACIVGSANISNNALAFISAERLLEASVVVDSTDPRYRDAQAWFWSTWTLAQPVGEIDLRDAKKKWEVRRKYLDEVGLCQDTEYRSAATSMSLSEDIVFRRASIGRNRIRMAGIEIERQFEAIESKVDNSNIRIPAFVANILWTLSGRTVQTAIPYMPIFSVPSQVWSRALEEGQPKYNERGIKDLISLIANNQESSIALRFWAKRYLEEGFPGAPSGA